MPVSPNAAGAPAVQRLRVTFGVSDRAQYASHLDLTRAWVRALRRLQAPLAYTLGYNPHPRISVAAPLPVGFAGERELLDLYLEAPIDPHKLKENLQGQLPAGLAMREVEAVPLEGPPLPALVEAADYVVSLYEPPADLARRLRSLMAAESLPFTRVRQDREIRFDLRPRILRAEVRECNGQPSLLLRLAHGPGGAARPEDVVTALGLDPRQARSTRVGLVLGEVSRG